MNEVPLGRVPALMLSALTGHGQTVRTLTTGNAPRATYSQMFRRSYRGVAVGTDGQSEAGTSAFRDLSHRRELAHIPHPCSASVL